MPETNCARLYDVMLEFTKDAVLFHEETTVAVFYA